MVYQNGNTELTMDRGRLVDGWTDCSCCKRDGTVQEAKFARWGCLHFERRRCNFVSANGYYAFVFTRKAFLCSTLCVHCSLPLYYFFFPPAQSLSLSPSLALSRFISVVVVFSVFSFQCNIPCSVASTTIEPAVLYGLKFLHDILLTVMSSYKRERLNFNLLFALYFCC